MPDGASQRLFSELLALVVLVIVTPTTGSVGSSAGCDIVEATALTAVYPPRRFSQKSLEAREDNVKRSARQGPLRLMIFSMTTKKNIPAFTDGRRVRKGGLSRYLSWQAFLSKRYPFQHCLATRLHSSGGEQGMDENNSRPATTCS